MKLVTQTRKYKHSLTHAYKHTNEMKMFNGDNGLFVMYGNNKSAFRFHEKNKKWRLHLNESVPPIVIT